VLFGDGEGGGWVWVEGDADEGFGGGEDNVPNAEFAAGFEDVEGAVGVVLAETRIVSLCCASSRSRGSRTNATIMPNAASASAPTTQHFSYLIVFVLNCLELFVCPGLGIAAKCTTASIPLYAISISIIVSNTAPISSRSISTSLYAPPSPLLPSSEVPMGRRVSTEMTSQPSSAR